VGWAPLPPEAHFERGSGIHAWADNYYDIGPDQYAFVSTGDFGNERIDRSLVPSDRNVTIVDQTTNVTNITYSNTTIVNQGPNFEEVRSHSRRPIERLRLQRETTVNFGSNDPRAVVRGEVLEMPAPVIARAQSVDRPRNVKQNVLQAVVDHGWENVTDHQAADRVRIKMKGEATPPPNAPSRTFVKATESQPAAATSSVTPPPPAATATPGASTATSVAPIATPTATATGTTAGGIPRRPLPPGARPLISPPIRAHRSPPAAAATATISEGTAPIASATPVSSATTEGTPVNATTPSRPARSTPVASAIPSATPDNTNSAPGNQSGRGNAKQERKAERQLRREQNTAVEPSPTAAASPATSSSNSTPVGQATPAAASTPDNSGSPSLSRKEQRKEQRRARRAGEPEETPSPSPQ
jgi:hypothetical protein